MIKKAKEYAQNTSVRSLLDMGMWKIWTFWKITDQVRHDELNRSIPERPNANWKMFKIVLEETRKTAFYLGLVFIG